MGHAGILHPRVELPQWLDRRQDSAWGAGKHRGHGHGDGHHSHSRGTRASAAPTRGQTVAASIAVFVAKPARSGTGRHRLQGLLLSLLGYGDWTASRSVRVVHGRFGI